MNSVEKQAGCLPEALLMKFAQTPEVIEAYLGRDDEPGPGSGANLP